MRYVSLAKAAAVSILMSAAMFGQTLTVTNFQLVSQVYTNYTYTAQINNTGGALASVTATATTQNPFAVRIAPNEGTLNFGPVPANGSATSSNSFTIIVVGGAPISWANIAWSFQTTPAPPVANAGPNQTATLHQTVTLDGGASTNPSGVGTLTYLWSFLARPGGSSASLLNSQSVHPTFVVDLAGTYTIHLTVSNGTGSSSATVTVNASTDTPPVANAGPNQTVTTLPASITLNGAGSSDVNGDPLTYLWSLTSIPAGSTATLSNPTAMNPTFVADKDGNYIAQLVVNDGTLNSIPSKVTISDNTPPVASAGSNQTMVPIGSTVQLNGSGSTDVDGDPLTYQWSLISPPPGSKAVLSSTSLVNPTFIADLPGTYVVQLIVADNSVASPPATVQITTNQPLPPIANAGPNQTVAPETLVSLNGSASTDPQGLQLTYSWSLTSKPGGSKATLTAATTATPTFLADLPGPYVAQLIVNDGYASSNPALSGSTVTISSSPLPPIASAGSAQSVNVGSTVTLNGSGSSDPNTDPLTYSWTLSSTPSGSKAALTNPTTVSPTFVPDLAGAYVAQLMVTDSFGLTSNPPATVMITAAVVSTPAILLQGGVQVNVGGQTTLSVSLSSPAPAGGVYVILASNSSNVTLTSSGIYYISAGSMVPIVTPKVNGIGFGSATITATAFGYQAATTSVVSTDTATFNPNTMIITGEAMLRAFLYLASAAPASGVTLNLSSSNPAVATVPATVTIPSGVNSVTVPVSGVSGGTAVITASNVASNIAPATLTVTVNAVEITTTQLNNGLFNAPYSQQLTAINGTTPYKWSLASGGTLPTGMTLSPGGLLGGTPTATTPVSGTPITIKVTDSSVPAQTATVTWSLLVVVGTPASIAATGGVTQQTADTTAFATQLVATVKDVNGYLVPSITVTFTVQPNANGASGTFPGPLTMVTANTNSSGVATAPVLTANGILGSYTVSASVSQVTTAAVFNLTNVVGPAATITTNGGSPQNTTEGTGFGSPLSVTLKDAGGNLVPNAVVTFNVPPSGASASFTGGNTATSNSSGIAVSNPVVAGATAGSYMVTATSGTGSASFSLTNNVGSAASVAVTPAVASAMINQGFPALVATVKDSGGNPVPNVAVTFAAVPGTNGQSATFTPATPVTTGSNGTATVAATANAKVGAYSVTASAAGVPAPFTLTLTNLSGPVASITPSGASSQTVGDGAAFAPLVALVQDAGGNPVGGVTVTFTITPATNGASATFSGVATAVTNTSGLATSPGTLTANTIVGGPYTVTAAVSAQITTTFSLSNKVGSAAKIAVNGTLPGSVGINQPFAALVAKVTDPGGNPVSGVGVTFQAPASSASGTFAGGANTSTATTDLNGLATASTYTANSTIGADTVSAFVTATPAISTTFALNNLVGTPASIAMNGGSPQATTFGTSFAAALSAMVKDSGGNPIPNAAVTFSAPTTGASAGFPTITTTMATTGANGIATTSVVPTANSTMGSYTVTASVAGVQTPASFMLTNNPGPPASITPVTGTSTQSTAVNTPFPQALQAKVTDKSGNPVTGVTVTFAAVANNGASGTFGGSATTTVQTDSTGTASATLTANTKAGGFTATATVAASSPVISTTFKLTSTAGAGAAIAATSGSGQSATINSAFANPLVATVTDQYGNLVSGATVTFTSSVSPNAGATVAPSTPVVTSALGTATVTATANSVAAAYSVTATTGTSISTTFKLTNNVGPIANVTITSGNNQTIGIGTAYAPLSVTVTDAGNNPISGANVIFSIVAGGTGQSAAFSGTGTATANSSGVATSPGTLTANGTLGQFSVSVRPTTGSGSASFTLTNIPGPPKTGTIISGSPQSAQVGQPFATAMAVTLKDSAGNLVVNGTQVTFTATTVSGATGTFASGASAPVLTVGSSGIATAPTFTAGTGAGTYTVTVTSGSATLATFSLTNTPGSAANIAIKTGSPQSAVVGSKFATAMAVNVTDTYGNLVAATPVTFAPPAATGTNATGTFATTSISETTSAGVATVPANSLTADTVAGSFSLTVTAGTATLQFPLTNTSGPAAKIAPYSGSPQSAQVGVPFTNPLVAVVTDTYSNLVSGATVTFTAPSSSPSGSPTGTFAPNATSITTATTGANGLATSATYTPSGGAGTDIVTAKVGSLSTTFTLTNQSGPAAKITPVSSTNNQAVAVTQTFAPLAVTVTDIGGNLVSGATVTFTAPASTGPSGTFAGNVNTATTNSSGVATSAVYTANNLAGTDAVTATVSPGNGSATFTLTNKPGPPAIVTAISGNNQQVSVASNYAGMGVSVTDAFGNPVGSGVTVTFTVNAASNGAGGTFAGGAAATTNASGVATSNALTADHTVGAFTVTASVVGGTISPTISLVNLPGPPANVTPSSGNNQTAIVNSQFTVPLAATVTDSFGNPVAAGTSVTFSAPTSGASGTFGSSATTAAATTNASGVATASPAFVANTTAGTYTATATAGKVTGSFALTNLHGPVASITATGGTLQTAYIGEPFASPLQALVRDAFNNPISGVTVIFTGPGLMAAQRPIFGDDPYGNTSTAVTGTSGIATSLSVSAGTVSGPAYSVTANVSPALTTPATYSLTNSATGGSTVGQITMTAAAGGNLTLGQNMMIEVQINLPAPAPSGGVTIRATTDGVNLMLGQNQGVQTETIPFTVGQTSVNVYVQALSNVGGPFAITLEASGYTTGEGNLTVTPSGFILAGSDGVVPPDVSTLSTFAGATSQLFVFAVQLDSNNNFVSPYPLGQIRGGFTASVPIAVAGPAVGTIPSSVTVAGGTFDTPVTFVATTTGAASINLGPASGFNQPNAYVSLPVTVGPASIVMQNATVGLNLESGVQFTLDGVAPACPGNSFGYEDYTVQSGSANLLLSNSPATAGTSSISVPVECGGSTSSIFYVQVVGGSVGASLTYNASGPGFPTSPNGTITVGPAGFVVAANNNTPYSGQYFRSTATGPGQTILVYSYLLDGTTHSPVTPQSIAPSLGSVNVPINSDNTSVGTVFPTTVTISGGTDSATTVFTPLLGGPPSSPATANVKITTVPGGFTAANSAYATIQAQVTNPGFSISDGGTVGQFLQTSGTVGVGTPVSGNNPLVVQLQVISGSIALSANGTDGGFQSIQVQIQPGSETSPTYFIYGLGSGSTGTYQASYVSGGSGTNFTPNQSTVTLAPSGVALVGENGTNQLFTSVGSPISFTVELGVLNSSGGFVGQQPPMGNSSVTANLTVSGSGTIGSPGAASFGVTFPAGSATASVPFNPTSTGSATINLVSATGVTEVSTPNSIGVTIN